MEASVNYSNSPITEAIIAIDVDLPASTTFADFQPFWEQVKSDYPSKEILKVMAGRISWSDGISQSAKQKDLGISGTNQAKTANFQARLNGFSCHRLAPYESWAPFCQEAKRLWSIYREVMKPSKVTRIAVRYINRFDFPGEPVELSEYLKTVPSLSPELPQGLAGYFMQLNVPAPEIKGVILINEAIVEPSKPGVLSVVLDIDMYRTAEIPDNELGIWELLEDLHVQKNITFEACITEKTRKLIR